MTRCTLGWLLPACAVALALVPAAADDKKDDDKDFKQLFNGKNLVPRPD